MIKVFYIEVPDKPTGDALAHHFKLHEGLEFVHADPVPGTLSEVQEILGESNAFPSQLYIS